MSALSMHPIEYLRLHMHYEGVWTRGGKLFLKRVFEWSEQAATIAAICLMVGLVIFNCMKIGQIASAAANYNAVITEIVFPPLQTIPTGL